MGIQHSLNDEQVGRVGESLQNGAQAIMDISERMEHLEGYVREMRTFNESLSEKVDNASTAIARLDKTLNNRIDRVLTAMAVVTDGTPERTENALEAIRSINVQEAVANANKAMVPLTIPFIVLLVELAVANAYLGILLASMPDARDRYSTFLITNAGAVLCGLTVGLLWLGMHRLNQNRESKLQQDADPNVVEGGEQGEGAPQPVPEPPIIPRDKAQIKKEQEAFLKETILELEEKLKKAEAQAQASKESTLRRRRPSKDGKDPLSSRDPSSSGALQAVYDDNSESGQGKPVTSSV